MSFEKEYALKKEEFENYLNDMIASLKDIPEPLISSMKYSLLSGGKRLRPVLLLETNSIFGGKKSQSVILFACAIECIHTYSLVHDDLPCMDNDDYRRGVLTNHKVFGEAVATLCGDALLNLAFELMFKAVALADIEQKDRFLKAASLIAEAVGAKGMIAGQVLDIQLEQDKTLVASKLNYIYQHKTCDLISAALLAGALTGDARDDELKIIKEFGDNFGYSFQIVDDLLDYDEGNKEETTFVSLYGRSFSRKALGDSATAALEHIAFVDRDVSFLRALAKNYITRKS